MFKSLKIQTWRQIEKIEIVFHNRLTILTGANGTGKTTILNLLSRHFGWHFVFISTPIRDRKTGILRYFSDFWKSIFPTSGEPTPTRHIIGEITYQDSKVASLSIPSNDQLFTVDIQPQYIVRGLHIPSHRPIYTHQMVDSIPTQAITRDQAFGSYSGVVRQRYMGESGGRNPNFHIKQSLLSWAAYGYGNEVVLPNPTAIRLFKEFEEILRKVLPPKLGFQRIIIETPEVLLATRSGNFSLDGVSGGIASIIDMAWQIFMYPAENNPFVVTIDEPENHLHPELQQLILPGFLDAFPHVQFIVATHNPFIISSILDSNVYVLDFNEKAKVESKYLDFVNKAGTANEILREVLGVPFTIPIWVEQRLEKVVEKYSEMQIGEAELKAMKEEMVQLGLAHLFPEAVVRVLGESK